jgi:hypothetical protein
VKSKATDGVAIFEAVLRYIVARSVIEFARANPQLKQKGEIDGNVFHGATGQCKASC